MRYTILLDFRHFLTSNSSYSKAVFDVKSFLTLLFFKILVVLLMSTLIFTLGIENFQHVDGWLGTSKFKIVLNAVILAPIMEEFMFRYHQKLSIQRLLISFLFALIMFHSSLFHLLIFGLYMGGLALLLKFRTPPSRIIIVFLSALMFALFHLANYNTLDVLTDFYYIPVLILSQFVGAFILSFIFWNYGLKYSILFHMAWNSIFILPKLLL